MKKRAGNVILSFTNKQKIILVAICDICLCLISTWLSYYLRMGEFVNLQGPLLYIAFFSSLLLVGIFNSLGIYRVVSRYIGINYFHSVLFSLLFYGIVFSIPITIIGYGNIPRTLGLIQPLVLTTLVMISRLTVKYWLKHGIHSSISDPSSRNVMIYGAGKTGCDLAKALIGENELKFLGFLDDDKNLHGRKILSYYVYDPTNIEAFLKHTKIHLVLIAVPNISFRQIKKITSKFEKFEIEVKKIPRQADIAKGVVSITDFQELDIEDLLGRDPIPPDTELIGSHIMGKIVLVTGSGGSIGSEICRQVIRYNPSMLVLYEISEFALYTIVSELEGAIDKRFTQLISFLGSVTDEQRFSEAVELCKPDIIYHAAAYKHVPLVEKNIGEGVKNNIIGTYIASKVARDNGVKNFVLISTDKAVRPTNIMGATKRFAEIIVQNLALSPSSTIFSIVRFGNVLNSSGSVIPLFRKQISEGGPLTLTHKDITRFFMTIEEASQLVIQSGAIAEGGQVFLLDMGEPVKIEDLLIKLVHLSGLKILDPNTGVGDIAINVVGLRPGEKLYEELLIDGESIKTSHQKIWISREEIFVINDPNVIINKLLEHLKNGEYNLIKSQLSIIIKNYTPDTGNHDFIEELRTSKTDNI
jgi:FlaA1/EpsC-like NDP-sugar epimerase